MKIGDSFNSALNQLETNLNKVRSSAEEITKNVEIDSQEEKREAAAAARDGKADTAGAINEFV